MDVDAEIAALDALSSERLRQRWIVETGNAEPRVSPKLLRLALAWEIQARRLGGHTRETTRTLDQLVRGDTPTTPPAAGMRLVREWGGRVHVVVIDEDQVVRWDGKKWNSLSEVARAITGTRWSGPAFFGLKKKVAA
ncbi:DUF2924 domain-containing protein [Sphingomonas sp. NBWT7]|uniref:DUF2924 domain-containing protein n=1 Tax=Sphingomonas sp. NBWT7 TaxID=2596913 RepID=UPI00162594B6|nr:DUF2924 domain-containing protein [Sphingomonas sp. NBWT7]QNE32987.1 DUF2924 domain-containing protein [Sphingomonas sp. NBWT7]